MSHDPIWVLPDEEKDKKLKRREVINSTHKNEMENKWYLMHKDEWVNREMGALDIRPHEHLFDQHSTSDNV